MEGFKKFKRKILAELAVKSALLGLSIAFLVAGILTALHLFKVISLELWIYAIIAVVLGLGVGIAWYFIRKPSDILIARRIDKELDLKAKTETMIQFQNEEGDFYELQREDAKEAIKNSSLKGVKFTLGLFFIIFPIVCLALGSTSSAAVIQREINAAGGGSNGGNDGGPGNSGGDSSSDNVIESAMVKGIRAIIAKVELSKVDARLKDAEDADSYIAVLNELIDVVKDAEKDFPEDGPTDEDTAKLQETCLKTIEIIYLKRSKINSNEEIGAAFKKQVAYPPVEKMGFKISDLDVDGLDNQLNNLAYVSLVATDDATVEDAVTLFATNYQAAIDRVEKVDFKDPLLQSLSNLYSVLKNVTYSGDGVKDNAKVIIAIDEAKSTILAELEKQSVNDRMAQVIETDLRRVFGIKKEQQENNNEDDFDEELFNPDTELGEVSPLDPDADGEKHDNAGGVGLDEVLYGSNDLFYDPELGLIQYGDALNKYYAIIYQMQQDGLLTEEEAQYFQEYYDRLYGTKKDN